MKMLLMFTLLLSSFAYSGEYKVFEKPTSAFYKEIDSDFAINTDLGRAWIDITVGEKLNSPRREHPRKHYRQKVEGLYYDQNSEAIMLETGGELIECASVRRGRIFRNLVIKSTGCRLESKIAYKTIDDGYNQYRRRFFQVFLITK
jgi:hypothetical protein